MVVGKMNRAAREDTGFTWIVSILIIVFILAMYLIFGVSGAYGAKKLSQDREMVLTEGSSRLSAIEEFIDFLDKEINFNDKKILVKDLVKGNMEDNSESWKEFGRLSRGFLEGLVDDDYVSGWIKIYEKNQEVGMEGGSLYQVVSNVVSCSSDISGADVFIVLSHDKKIVFCIREVKI